MSKGTGSAKRTIALAYFHRYGWIAAMMGLVLILQERTLCVMGISFVVYSLWSFFGYKLKWKHIYCSFQNAYRKAMTPHSICWGQIRKSDAYGCPLVFLVLGLALLIIDVLY